MQENNVNIVVNDIVEHQRFGLGLVEKIEGDIQNKKATIICQVGERQLEFQTIGNGN